MIHRLRLLLDIKTNAALAVMVLTVGGCGSSLSLEDKHEFLTQRISVYVSHFGKLPESLNQLNEVVPKEKRAEWDEVIAQMTVDSWGNSMMYSPIEEGKKFELRSAGPDGSPNTADDVIYIGPDSPFGTFLQMTKS